MLVITHTRRRVYLIQMILAETQAIYVNASFKHGLFRISLVAKVDASLVNWNANWTSSFTNNRLHAWQNISFWLLSRGGP
jgi:hypothetical protein